MKKWIGICLLTIMWSVHSIAQFTGSIVVVNKLDNNVSLIDVASGETKAIIAVPFGPHEAAVSPSGKMAAVSIYGDVEVIGSSIAFIDLEKKALVKVIELGKYTRPHGIEFLNEDELLSTCETMKVLLKISVGKATIEEVAGTKQTGSHMVALSRSNGLAYVSNVHVGSVSVIDVNAGKLLKVIPLKAGVEGLDVSPNGKELWVANRVDSTIIVIDTDTYETIDVLLADRLPFRVKFSNDGKWVAVSNASSGTLSVFNTTKKRKKETLDFKLRNNDSPLPVGIAADIAGDFFFVCMAGQNTVMAIRPQNLAGIAKIYNCGSQPDGIYFSPILL